MDIRLSYSLRSAGEIEMGELVSCRHLRNPLASRKLPPNDGYPVDRELDLAVKDSVRSLELTLIGTIGVVIARRAIVELGSVLLLAGAQLPK